MICDMGHYVVYLVPAQINQKVQGQSINLPSLLKRQIDNPLSFLDMLRSNHESYFIYSSDAFIARTHPIHESDRAIMKYFLFAL